MAALQIQLLRNFFGDFDHRINELTSGSQRWEDTKIWLLDHFQELLFLTCAILFPAFIFVVLVDHWDIDRPQPVGCKKVGRSSLSSIKKASTPTDGDTAPSEATDKSTRSISPIQGCSALEIQDDEGDQLSTKYDGQFAFAQLVTSRPEKQKDHSEETAHQWSSIDRSKFPQLAFVEVELWVPDETNRQYSVEREAIKNGGSLTVSFPFKPESVLSMQYLDYLYTSLKAKYIRGSLSAHAMVVFEVPFLPTAERMQRKSYSPTEQVEYGKTKSQAINLDKEIAPDALAKLKHHLGVSNPLTLFRVDAGRVR